MNSDDLEIRIQDLFEGQLNALEIRELEEELRTNQHARDLYHAYSKLHGAMLYRSEGIDPAQVIPMNKAMQRGHRRLFRRALVSAAAIFVVGALVLSVLHIRGDEPRLSVKVSQGTQFAITHAPSDEPAPEGLLLEIGSRLDLRKGTVELDFASGVRSIVRAPAELRLLDDHTLQMARGSGWFEVPSEASGFQVITPDLVLTDIGTEFGIRSQPDYPDEAHVFRGTVEVMNYQGLGQNQVMKTGQAARVEMAGSWTPIDLDRSHFLDELPEVEPDPFSGALFHDSFTSNTTESYLCVGYIHGSPTPGGYFINRKGKGILEVGTGGAGESRDHQVVLRKPTLLLGQTLRVDFLTNSSSNDAIGIVLTDDPTGQRYKLRCRFVANSPSIDFGRGARGKIIWRNRSPYNAPETFWIERLSPVNFRWYRGITVDERILIADITLEEDPGPLHVGVQSWNSTAIFDDLAILDGVTPKDNAPPATEEN